MRFVLWVGVTLRHELPQPCWWELGEKTSEVEVGETQHAATRVDNNITYGQAISPASLVLPYPKQRREMHRSKVTVRQYLRSCDTQEGSR